jgi:hypothetical protein
MKRKEVVKMGENGWELDGEWIGNWGLKFVSGIFVDT